MWIPICFSGIYGMTFLHIVLKSKKKTWLVFLDQTSPPGHCLFQMYFFVMLPFKDLDRNVSPHIQHILMSDHIKNHHIFGICHTLFLDMCKNISVHFIYSLACFFYVDTLLGGLIICLSYLLNWSLNLYILLVYLYIKLK